MKAKIIILSLLIITGINHSFAQILDSVPEIDSLINSGKICFDPVPEEDSIFIFAEHMPEFVGGELELRRFIAEHYNIPIESDVIGKIYIRFVVKKTGDIGKIEIVRGVEPAFDKEAIRVISLLPKFKPGMHKGNPVNVWYIIPISIQMH